MRELKKQLSWESKNGRYRRSATGGPPREVRYQKSATGDPLCREVRYGMFATGGSDTGGSLCREPRFGRSATGGPAFSATAWELAGGPLYGRTALFFYHPPSVGLIVLASFFLVPSFSFEGSRPPKTGS